MSQSAKNWNPLTDAVFDELLHDSHSNGVELEELWKAVEEGATGSPFPQVGSNDDFSVTPEIAALLHLSSPLQ